MALDLTKGNPSKLLLRFVIPMMISNVFQQFYNIADTLVVGRYIGSGALAAVGTTGNITSMVLMLMSGATSGVSVVVAQIYGSGNRKQLKRSVATSTTLVAILAILLGALGAIFARQLLKLINVPDDVLPDAMLYMRIILLGALATGVYNMASSLLRALGDSVTPLVFLIITSLLNVALNVLFVTQFHMGVAGVAWATIISSAISAVACSIYAWVRMPDLRFGLSDMKLEWKLVGMIAKIGLPSSLLSSTINIGMIMIQALVNSFGANVMAGYALGMKMENLLGGMSYSVANAMQVFSAQNVGAGNYERVQKGFRSALTIALCIVAVCSPLMIIFGRPILMFFTKDGKEVVDIAYRYSTMIAACFPFVIVLITTRNTMHGAGDAMIPLIMGLFELVSRFVCSYFLSIPFGYIGVFLGTPLAWLSAAIMGVVRYRSGKWKTKRLKIDAE